MEDYIKSMFDVEAIITYTNARMCERNVDERLEDIKSLNEDTYMAVAVPMIKAELKKHGFAYLASIYHTKEWWALYERGEELCRLEEASKVSA